MIKKGVSKVTNYDVIVIGAGPSGMMAAIQARLCGARVAILERNNQVGRKLLLTGGGRCNVTNSADHQELINHIPGNGKFLYSSLDQFDASDIIDFFTKAGIELKEEDHGRIFPVSNSARNIRDALLNKIKVLKIDLLLNQSLKSIQQSPQSQHIQSIRTQNGLELTTQSLILATGGKSYSRTGSQGDGYYFAQKLGHSITPLYPTEVPLLSNDLFIQSKELQGISLTDINLSLINERNKIITQHRMGMVFTHFGYSGPAVLRCSGHVNLWLRKHPQQVAQLRLDLTPDWTISTLDQFSQAHRQKELVTLLKHWMPEKLARLILKILNLDGHLAYKNLSPQQAHDLWALIKEFPLTAYQSQNLDKAFVTGGGVNLKEVVPQTMASKLVKGLYFCGELLDINGYTGGFNMTTAFVTGAVAGRHAALELKQA
ncbi:BaiN/RdsA family NAD(P)/FAD-dependent oxidoreductase [Facklamia hominis]|uniref:NAD(P)/FAD-dependent oxidoreductase n=1 Tax=Facklamia hominis TaxID=178214 RepID=UPI0038FC76AB